MASTDARPFPLKNVAYRVTFPILDSDGDLVTGASGLDSEVSKDGGAFADCTSEATEIAASSGMYYLDLTSTEMNADTVAIIVKTSTSGAKTTPIVLYPGSTTVATIGVNAVQAGGVVWGSGAITAGSIATDAVDGDAIAASAVTELQSGLATAAALATLQGLVDDLETRLSAARAGYLDNLSGGAVALASALATVNGYVDELEGRLTSARAGYLDALNSGVPLAAGTITEAKFSSGGLNAIADAILKRDWSAVTGEASRSVLNALRFLRNKWTAVGTTLTVTKEDDSTTAWTATITKDAASDPITGSDPT